ncbi:hypothetical protein GCM10009863_08160 [Streptomyces axinellae]|uniref:ABC transporter domain-containing protein n=1 Tax=Streptomyces axinellae TaxID=552788 RepID=A0ABN3PRL1_9ACTN
MHALCGTGLALPRGTFTAVMGPSGSGKTTFLQRAAGLDRPSSGTVHLGGTEITALSENQLTAPRRSRLGFVFPAFNLLPSLTVEQNVTLPRPTLTGHVTSACDREISVRRERGADTGAVARALSVLGEVSDKASYAVAALPTRSLLRRGCPGGADRGAAEGR